MPNKRHVEADKGRCVRVIGGKYAGCRGWVHKTANTFDDKVWIIIQQTPENAALLKKENISYHEAVQTPRTNEQALLSQHKDIAKTMKLLVKMLAEVEDYDLNEGMLSLFYDMWKESKAKMDSQSRTTCRRFKRIGSVPTLNNLNPTTTNTTTANATTANQARTGTSSDAARIETYANPISNASNSNHIPMITDIHEGVPHVIPDEMSLLSGINDFI